MQKALPTIGVMMFVAMATIVGVVVGPYITVFRVSVFMVGTLFFFCVAAAVAFVVSWQENRKRRR